MSERKYRQRGYMDRSEERGAPKEKPKKKEETFGPRALQMPGKRAISRCAQCGTVLGPEVDPRGQCPKCGAALHACKQCSFFDTGSRFECSKPIPERIPQKDAHNECPFFELQVRVERETSAGSGAVPSASPDDARRAFENLFKK
ncbi:MAG TPA: hypothetical protein VNK82_04350 [Terriglobales bacterium]|nr:hypothetical protein [Terriglobales bacterium]